MQRSAIRCRRSLATSPPAAPVADSSDATWAGTAPTGS